MAGPLANLRKPRKAPLPRVHPTGLRAAPFRNPTDLLDDDEDLLGRSVSRQSSLSSSRSETTGSRGNNHLPKLPRDSKTAPSDYELMSNMMSRIAKLELQVQFYTKEILEKDKKISILEEKTQLLQKYKGDPDTDSDKLRALEQKCQGLQQTIKDMEDFLADYGMVWVGAAESGGVGTTEGGVYEELTRPGQRSQTASVWRPGASVAQPDAVFHVDFDRVVENVQELNVIAGDGEKRIRHTVGGARFVAPDPVPLTLYANGIFMFNGPFRSYEEPTTQHCIQDLMDGYFPYELNERFPDGVPFKVTDKRDTVYNDPRHLEQFPGTGNPLGGENKPSRLVPSNLDKATGTERSYTTSHDGEPVYRTSQPPKPRLSVVQFLNKLPSAVMRDGKVIDVRASLAEDLKPDSTKPGVTVIDTPAVQEMVAGIGSRPQSASSPRPPSARSSSSSVTTLRVKTETGEHTLVLKMRYTDTIRHVRQYINANRTSGPKDYEIVTTFPAKVYDDQEATLQECGLTPNAALHLRAKKP